MLTENFGTIMKNIISGKIQGFGQSCLEARFSNPMSIQTAPNYRIRNFKSKKKFNITKNVISGKLQRLER